MVRTSFLREAADYIDKHPDEYEYGWRNCVAGTIAKLHNVTFEEHRANMVIIPGKNSVHLSDWVRDVVGLDVDQAHSVFVVMSGADRDDAHSVVEFVRRYADDLDGTS